MVPTVSAFSSALMGMRAALARMDRAAGAISRFGLDTAPPAIGPATPPAAAPAAPPAADPEMDLAGATVDLIVAQRAFAAQLRVIEVASQTTRDAIDVVGRAHER